MIDSEENTWYIVDFVITIDYHIEDKYMDLAAEVRRQFREKKVILPIVLRALGTVSAKLSEMLKKLDIEDIIGSLQTVALISSTAILRRVLNL